MTTVAVVGLGYVGLPLAIEFGKSYKTIGYDVSQNKVNSYRSFIDLTGEIEEAEFRASTRFCATTDPSELGQADIIVIAVPTPVDNVHQPDFRPLESASRDVGRNMRKGTIVIYESTVYPGATEEICVPILEAESGLTWKKDFNIGYSPERINPGDKQRTLTKIVKIVSGDNPDTLDRVAEIYGSIILAGVHRASSIRVAEAAKVIENTQRDLNIALVNELSIIFNRLGIDTLEVLEAAGTKWNFLPFRPGLVGGHCIGVDPYYLTHKAESVGYHPEVILAGRRINDGMSKFIAEQTVKQMIQAGIAVGGATANVLGLAFKENCADLRNSKVVEMIRELQEFGVKVYVNDPMCSREEALNEYGIVLSDWKSMPLADVLIVAVAHDEYLSLPLDQLLINLKKPGCIIDVKGKLPRRGISDPSIRYWRL